MQRFISKKDETLLPMATKGKGDAMGTGKSASVVPKVRLYFACSFNTSRIMRVFQMQTFTWFSWAWLVFSIVTIIWGVRSLSELGILSLTFFSFLDDSDSNRRPISELHCRVMCFEDQIKPHI